MDEKDYAAQIAACNSTLRELVAEVKALRGEMRGLHKRTGKEVARSVNHAAAKRVIR